MDKLCKCCGSKMPKIEDDLRKLKLSKKQMERSLKDKIKDLEDNGLVNKIKEQNQKIRCLSSKLKFAMNKIDGTWVKSIEEKLKKKDLQIRDLKRIATGKPRIVYRITKEVEKELQELRSYKANMQAYIIEKHSKKDNH